MNGPANDRLELRIRLFRSPDAVGRSVPNLAAVLPRWGKPGLNRAAGLDCRMPYQASKTVEF